MEGFEAISYHNGWAMAIVGATIVFIGLVILSFAISQIHRLLMFWDEREIYIQRLKNSKANIFNKRANRSKTVENHLTDINKTAQSYLPLIEQLGKSFQLAELFNLAKKNNLPHPHLTITRFRKEKILIPEGDGSFTWNL